MNIPEAAAWHKGGEGREDGREGRDTPQNGFLGSLRGISGDWALITVIVLTGTLCLGLGLEIRKENAAPAEPLWIEQLPPSVLPGSVATGTLPAQAEAGQGTATAPAYLSQSAAAAVAPISPSAAAVIAPTPHNYVASKTGKKYYLPSCSGAKRIKEENKVWFDTKAAAEAAGYTAASTCKGL